MRIMLLCARHHTGGADAVAIHETDILLNRGHEVAHFSLTFNPEIIHCPAKHYFARTDWTRFFKKPQGAIFRTVNVLTKLDDRAFWNNLMVHQFRKALLDFKPDVVHFHFFKDFILRPWLFKVTQDLGIPTVFTIHGSYFVCPAHHLLKGETEACDGICSREETPGASLKINQCVPNPIRQQMLLSEFKSVPDLARYVDLFTSPSTALYDLVLQSGRASKERLKLLYNPGNPALLSLQTDFDTPLKQSYILAVGRLEWFKGFQHLIHAITDLPDIPVKIVGDGPARPALEALCHQHEISNVTFLGWQKGDALWQLYKDAYAVVLPSIYFENAPVVVQEAFSLGKAIIGSRSGGISEFVRHGTSGLIYDTDNIDQLRKAILSLWSDPELTARMGRAGYDLIHEYFDPEYTALKLEETFAEAIEICQKRIQPIHQ